MKRIMESVFLRFKQRKSFRKTNVKNEMGGKTGVPGVKPPKFAVNK